jgi:hypothetical protein
LFCAYAVFVLIWFLATKEEVQAHFATHGTGEIVEIKLMNGFGFIEYKDAMDARDVVPGMTSTTACPLHLQIRVRRLTCNAVLQLSVRHGPFLATAFPDFDPPRCVLANMATRWIGFHGRALDRPVRTRLPPA